MVADTRRPWITVALLSVFSFVIEVVQRWTRLGVADVSDLVANIVGTAAGAAIGVVMMRQARTHAAGTSGSVGQCARSSE